MFAITTEDSVDLAIVQRVLEVLILHVMVQVVVGLRVVDGVYIDVSVGAEKGFFEERVMLLGVSGVDGVKILWLVVGFRDGQGLLDPIYGGVCDTEPGESEDVIFVSTAHNVEEMFLGDPFNVGVEGTSITYRTSFVHSLIHIANSDGGGKFFGGEVMFPDKLPVNAGDVSTRVYQCRGVDNFEGVWGCDQLNRDMHRFVWSGYKYRGVCY